MKPRIGRTLGGFHNRVDCFLTGIESTRYIVGRWEYLPLVESIVAVVLEEVETYLLQRQNTVAQYIATCLILEICLVEEQRPGAWVS